jgi:hypothetical protein
MTDEGHMVIAAAGRGLHRRRLTPAHLVVPNRWAWIA